MELDASIQQIPVRLEGRELSTQQGLLGGDDRDVVDQARAVLLYGGLERTLCSGAYPLRLFLLQDPPRLIRQGGLDLLDRSERGGL